MLSTSFSTSQTPADISKSPMPVSYKNESLSQTETDDIEVKTKSSQFSWNKIELYLDTNIESQQSWLEKERMKFWNVKGQALQISKEMLGFNKTDLVGADDVSWTYRKVELLNIKFQNCN